MIAIEGKRLALTGVSSGEGKRGSFRGYPGCETGCEEDCPYVSAYPREDGKREPAGTGTPVLTVSVSYAMSIADISPDMFLL